MSNEMGKGIGIGIAAGVLIGLAVGYLTSPKSGKENREWTREKAGQFREKAKEMKARMRKKSDGHEEEDLEEVQA
jgi:gas vesicle protein